MESLPGDIVADILVRLPVKSVMICRCVSKSWKHLTHQPSFTRDHLKRTLSLHQPHSNFILSNLPTPENNTPGTPQFNLEYYQTLHDYTCNVVRFSESQPNFLGLRVVGSCNGLICLVGFGDHQSGQISISNPFTRSCRKLPDPVDYSRDTAVGFGFDPQMNQYKVVTIRNDDEGGSYRAKVCVFTLGTDESWRRLGTILRKIDHWEMCPKQVFVNGALHWFSCRVPGLNALFIAFDVASEEFQGIPLPRYWFGDCPSLGVLDGCLSFTGFENPYNEYAEIWVMKDYGFPESWIKRYYVYFPDIGLRNQLIVRTICLHRDGELLVLYHLGVLVACNVRTGRIRRITFSEVQLPFNFEVIEHVATLVSPFDV